MAHRIIRIGSKPGTAVNLDDASQVSWPDRDLRVDVNGVRIENTGVLVKLVHERLGRLRAVALAYDTDWDLVRIRPGSADAMVLGPGAVLDLSSYGVDQLFVEPHVNVPSTRLYDATTLQGFGGGPPTVAPAGDWVIGTGAPHFKGFISRAGNPALYYWARGLVGANWPAGPWVQNGGPIAANGVSPNTVLDENRSAAVTGTLEGRPADVSPDGLYSFADYVEAGLIKWDDGTSAAGVAYVSLAISDSRGQPGSNGQATTVRYAVGSSLYATVSPKFYGRLSLEVWTDDDCPPRGFVPRLAPVRYVSLDAIAHAGGAAAPDTAIVTVPAINIERAQYIARNMGAGNVFAQLIQPRAEDWIDQVAGVADVDPATGNAFTTIANGADGAAFLEEPASPFIKLAIGADGGGATIAARSVLSLVRRAA